jgi:photosystem II stability/assembly factor-like uncharacterized protein
LSEDMKHVTALLAAAWLFVPAGLSCAEAPSYAELLNSIEFRNLGPFCAGSWVPDIAVPETPAKAHLRTFYVAARTGGLWKTTNNGTTFQPMTDKQGILSIGAVAVAPSDENVVWLGGGDASNTRSAYYGDGVFRSLDSGRTWEHMGLDDTQHISRIVVHPSNPEIVYVAALGHLYTANDEPGVYKTADGGKTWTKVLYVGPNVGAVDLVMDRRDPNLLFAATDDFQRFPWTFRDGGPGSAIYKTTDGGTRWRSLLVVCRQARLAALGWISAVRSQTLFGLNRYAVCGKKSFQTESLIVVPVDFLVAH